MVNLFIMKTIINTTIEFDLVRRDISQLRKVANQSQALCMAAVKINPKAILYMHTYYEDVYVYAVSQSSDLFKHITDQTDKICLSAVAKEGLALRYVIEQTEKICQIAIHSNPFSLKYAMHQTETLCMQAIASHAFAI